ncbi:MAG TPA: glycosyltransferase family 39 protein [Roseiflexaceae bacterium]|nr:glycosyltransferase family 39 protein [Roseiflexaceae bacterium]
MVAFVALATLYSVITPLGEGPDEPGHARYVFFLAREGRLPVQRAEAGESDVPGEGHQPPLAYVLMAPLVAWLPQDQRQFDLPGNPRFTWAAPSRLSIRSGRDGPAPAIELNAVAHGSREYLPWRGFVLAWHLARLVSVALGTGTVVLTYLAARALIDEKPETKDQIAQSPFVLSPSTSVALLAAALVAFNPQFLFISGLVTNDGLLVMLSAALLWLALRREPGDGRGSRTTNRSVIGYAVAIGFVLGLALIAKQSAIILAPVAFLAVLEHSRSAANSASDRASERSSGRAGAGRSLRGLVTLSPSQLVGLVVLAGVTLLISGWWYARNWRLYGDLFGLAAFQAEFVTQAFDAANPAAWLAALAQLHGSFWARFGWMNVMAPGWAIGAFVLVELVAVIGWLSYADQRRKTKDESTNGGPSSFVLCLARWWPLLALPVLAFGWMVSFALTAGLVAWQGRLLFPALPALAIGMAWGIIGLAVGSHLKGARSAVGRIACLAFWLLPTACCLLAAWLPFGVIQPAYPRHTLPEALALERLGTPVYGRFGMVGDPGVELRGWSLSGSARPGDTPELTLIWYALGRQNRNWTVFIHLVDAQERIVAQDNRPPRDDAFPMLQWVAGDWVEDRHPLALPADLAPGEYHLRVGLFYPRTDRRAGMYNQRGQLSGDYLDIGSLTLRS